MIKKFINRISGKEFREHRTMLSNKFWDLGYQKNKEDKLKIGTGAKWFLVAVNIMKANSYQVINKILLAEILK